MEINNPISSLEQTLFSLHPKAEEYYNAISALKSMYNSTDIKEPTMIIGQGSKKQYAYNVSNTVAGKILFALNELGRFSKIHDIKSKINEYEPNFVAGLNTGINILKKSGKVEVKKASTSNRDTFYGLKIWLNEDSTIKEAYLYDESLIVANGYSDN